jgi:ParB family chromosome partitioning protein
VISDQCLDGKCFQTKITEHIDREIAAPPELIQIENGWRNAREQRPGAVQRGHFHEIETVVENPDAEPAPPCAAAKPAIIVYGKRVGTTLTGCTDNHCPVHDPRAAAEQAADPAPTMEPAREAETQEEVEERQRNYEQQRKEYEQEQERKAEERKQQFEREEKEHEAERARREKWHKARVSKFDRIIDKAPAMFSAALLRVFLRALVNIAHRVCSPACPYWTHTHSTRKRNRLSGRGRSRVCSPSTQEGSQQESEDSHTDQDRSEDRSEEDDG